MRAESKYTTSLCATCPARDGVSFCDALHVRRPSDSAPRGQLPRIHERAAAQDIIYSRGQHTNDICVLCQGWAITVATLPNGLRQILAVLLPGEPFSITAVFADTLPFTIQAVTDVIYTRFKNVDVRAQMVGDPAIVTGLGQICVIEHTAMNDLVIDLGKRDAEQRVASLLLRLTQRLSSRFVIHGHRYPFPLRQRHIADMLGLTPVHVSRVMAGLRKSNIIDLRAGFLTILDRDKLDRIGRLG